MGLFQSYARDIVARTILIRTVFSGANARKLSFNDLRRSLVTKNLIRPEKIGLNEEEAQD